MCLTLESLDRTILLEDLLCSKNKQKPGAADWKWMWNYSSPQKMINTSYHCFRRMLLNFLYVFGGSSIDLLYPIGSMYIHGAAIYGNMDPINIPQMLAYIPAPWILWVLYYICIYIYNGLKQFRTLTPLPFFRRNLSHHLMFPKRCRRYKIWMSPLP